MPTPLVTAAAAAAVARRRWSWLLPVLLAPLGLVGVVVAMFVFALGGSDLGCLATSFRGERAQTPPTRSAVAEIPPARLRLYRRAGAAVGIDWAFLASIGAQECNHQICAGDNGSGCAGPMQISMRRGSPCSPGTGPTLWEQYGVDANNDGRRDVNDPADAIHAAARILRRAKGAPGVGGSYAEYQQAACNYYGACSVYADQVMARAVQYGFDGPGSPAPSDPDQARPAPNHPAVETVAAGCGNGGGRALRVDGVVGPVKRLSGPRRLELLSAEVMAAGYGPVSCDARIAANVEYLARRFGFRVTACQEAGHSPVGEHPVGAAIDAVPADGDWDRTMRVARLAGWDESCAASGVAPACARPPFRFVGYNGYPSHGDPAHCPPPDCPPHLHLSWNTSASQGRPEHALRTSYFAPSWIDAFTLKPSNRADRSRVASRIASGIAPQPRRSRPNRHGQRPGGEAGLATSQRRGGTWS